LDKVVSMLEETPLYLLAKEANITGEAVII